MQSPLISEKATKDDKEMQPADEDEDHSTCGPKVIKGIVVAIVAIAAIIGIYVAFKSQIAAGWHMFVQWCKGHGTMAYFLILFGTMGFTAFCLPAAFFFVAAASIFTSAFGSVWGTVAACTSCALGFWLGCSACFQLGKSVLKPMVEEKLKEFESMTILNSIIDSEGWTFAFLIRLSPFIPVEVLNPVSAMTNLTFGQNMLACMGSGFICLFEVYCYCQAAVAAMAASGGEHKKDGEEKDNTELYITIGVNVVIVVLLVFVVRRANSAYNKKLEEAEAEAHHKEKLARPAMRKAMRKITAMGKLNSNLGIHDARHWIEHKVTPSSQ